MKKLRLSFLAALIYLPLSLPTHAADPTRATQPASESTESPAKSQSAVKVPADSAKEQCLKRSAACKKECDYTYKGDTWEGCRRNCGKAGSCDSQ